MSKVPGTWSDEAWRAGRNKSTWREEKKALAAKTTGWNTYSIHDPAAVTQRLHVQHQAKKDVAAKLGQPIPTDHDFILAALQNDTRRERFIGAAGTYAPHQGKRECARRIRQGASP